MNKICQLFSLILCSVCAYSQQFQGLIVYESKTNYSDFKPNLEANKEITPEMQKMFQDRLKKISEKTYTLHFDKTAAIYQEEAKLDAPGLNGGGGMRIMSSFSGAGGKIYKSPKNKSLVIAKELMGKEFLITDTLTTYKWKMSSETKKIGNYNCFKATVTKAVSKTDFRNIKIKKPEDTKKDTDKTTATDFMSQTEMPKNIEVTAWYTPEIPVNQGPEGYWGLPGMILEVNDGKTTILCSKVVMNTKERIEIIPATNGEVVTQAKYDEIALKKMQEMQEMFQGQRGNNQNIRFNR